jgi:antitoxin ParD1/3/4
MTTVKIAVSLPPEQVEEAKRAVQEGRAPSVSAYVAEALSQRQRGDALAALLEELVAEHGVPSPADYDWAMRALGLA